MSNTNIKVGDEVIVRDGNTYRLGRVRRGGVTFSVDTTQSTSGSIGTRIPAWRVQPYTAARWAHITSLMRDLREVYAKQDAIEREATAVWRGEVSDELLESVAAPASEVKA